MANEIRLDVDTGNTYYVRIYNTANQVWNGASFVSISSAVWVNTAVSCSEAVASSGIYLATFPVGIVTAGNYHWIAYLREGGSPAVTDAKVAGGLIVWTGTAESDVQTESAKKLLTIDWTTITGEASRSVLNALRRLRNKTARSGTVGTVYKEDDATSAWTVALATDANAQPIITVDPD